MKETVVPKYESDDPLADNPVSVVAVDYREGTLIFKLSQKVNRDWIRIFQNPGTFGSLMGHEPNTFTFHEDEVMQRVEEQYAQKIVDFFKSYLELANQGYKKSIEREQRRMEQQERERLEAEIAQEEKRRRILGKLKI